jgi:hypothetical protein
VPLEELRPYLFLLRDRDATHHLMRVSGGLDSLVMGEGQILAQVGWRGKGVRQTLGEGEVPPLGQGRVRQLLLLNVEGGFERLKLFLGLYGCRFAGMSPNPCDIPQSHPSFPSMANKMRQSLGM